MPTRSFQYLRIQEANFLKPQRWRRTNRAKQEGANLHVSGSFRNAKPTKDSQLLKEMSVGVLFNADDREQTNKKPPSFWRRSGVSKGWQHAAPLLIRHGASGHQPRSISASLKLLSESEKMGGFSGSPKESHQLSRKRLGCAVCGFHPVFFLLVPCFGDSFSTLFISRVDPQIRHI